MPEATTGLTAADAAAVLAAAARLTAAPDRDGLWTTACAEVLALVPGLWASIDEIDERAMTSHGRWWPEEPSAWRTSYVDLHANHVPDHPLFLHVLGYAGALPSPPATWADHPVWDDFWETTLGREFYLLHGVRDQLAVRLDAPASVRLVLSVARSEPGFTDRERGLVAALSPHLSALDAVFRRLDRALAAPAALASEDWKTIVVDDVGTVQAATYDAVLMGEVLGLDLATGASLEGSGLWKLVQDDDATYRSAGLHTELGHFDVRIQRREPGRTAVFLRAMAANGRVVNEPRALVDPDAYDLEDQERLLRAIRRIGSAQDLEEFAEISCRELLDLVPGVWASYNEMNLLSGRTVGFRRPARAIETEASRLPVLIERAHQNPVVRHFAELGESATVTLGRLDPDGTFRDSELYAAYYGPEGVVDQAAFSLPAPPGVVITLVVNRATAGFSTRELRLMDELRLHLSNLYRYLAGSDRARGLTSVVENEGWETILVNDQSVVVESTEQAIAIGDLLGIGLRPGDSLDGTELWHPDHRDRPVRFTAGGGTFDASVVTTHAGPSVLLLRPAHSVTVESAMALGLTRRQAEVGLFIVDGASNQQIASALGISPHTVRKHVESVLAALGVQSRAAAAVALMRRRASGTGATASVGSSA